MESLHTQPALTNFTRRSRDPHLLSGNDTQQSLTTHYSPWGLRRTPKPVFWGSSQALQYRLNLLHTLASCTSPYIWAYLALTILTGMQYCRLLGRIMTISHIAYCKSLSRSESSDMAAPSPPLIDRAPKVHRSPGSCKIICSCSRLLPLLPISSCPSLGRIQ